MLILSGRSKSVAALRRLNEAPRRTRLRTLSLRGDREAQLAPRGPPGAISDQLPCRRQLVLLLREERKGVLEGR